VRLSTFLLALSSLSLAPAIFAHHSFAADYSASPITLNGTIVRFVWMNPHTRIDLDVTDANGKVARWSCEGNAPGGLLNNGWSRSSLKPGDRVQLYGFPAKDRSNGCKTRTVTLANGRRLQMD